MRSATFKGLARRVGLLKQVCSHCRRKTDMTPVFDELIELIVRELGSNGAFTIDGLGTIWVKRKKAGKANSKHNSYPEGLVLRFKTTMNGKQNIQAVYDEFKEYWRERFQIDKEDD